MGTRPLSAMQRRTLFAYLRPAAIEVGEDPESYRKRILREELQVEHLSEVSRGDGFDKLMSRICQDSGDFERAIVYAQGSLKRLKHLCVQAARQILAAAPEQPTRSTPYDYIAGVMYRARLIAEKPTKVFAEGLVSDAAWMRFSQVDIKAVLMMLNAHLSRLRRECAKI